MPLNIKNAEADRLVEALCELTARAKPGSLSNR